MLPSIWFTIAFDICNFCWQYQADVRHLIMLIQLLQFAIPMLALYTYKSLDVKCEPPNGHMITFIKSWQVSIHLFDWINKHRRTVLNV